MNEDAQTGTAAERPTGNTEERSIYAFADLLQRLHKEEEQVEETSLWVHFTVANRPFAIPISAAREIHRVGEIIAVPDAPPSARGVIQLRGRVVALVDTAVRLGFGETTIGPASRVLVVESRGRLVGLLVGSVERVVELELSQLERRSPADLADLASVLSGVTRIDGRTVGLLDIDEVLTVDGP